MGCDGDHIVPYKVTSEQLHRKEQSNESNKAVKPAEQSKNSQLGSSSGHSVDPGSRSAAELSKCLAEPARSYSSKTEKTSELWKVPDVFHSTAADEENKERGDFDEYGWANISSFDDLDRMFSNDVPTFGDGSLSGTDELWTSSKNVSSSPSKQLPSMLEPGDLGLDIRTEIEHQENQQFPLTGKANGPPSSQSVGVTQNLSSIIIRVNPHLENL